MLIDLNSIVWHRRYFLAYVVSVSRLKATEPSPFRILYTTGAKVFIAPWIDNNEGGELGCFSVHGGVVFLTGRFVHAHITGTRIIPLHCGHGFLGAAV